MKKILDRDTKTLGLWDGERIWRKLTPEEKLKRDTGLSSDVGATALLVLGSNLLSRVKQILK